MLDSRFATHENKFRKTLDISAYVAQDDDMKTFNGIQCTVVNNYNGTAFCWPNTEIYKTTQERGVALKKAASGTGQIVGSVFKISFKLTVPNNPK